MIIKKVGWLNKNVVGVTILPFIFFNKNYKITDFSLNHEKIHIKQQVELFGLLFFIVYGLEYLYRYLQYKNWDLAYRNISFEREAYLNQENLNYLKTRKLFRFLKYL